MSTLTPQVPGSENFLFWIQITISRAGQVDREKFTYTDTVQDWQRAQDRWAGVMADAKCLPTEIRCATLCVLHGQDEVCLAEVLNK